MPYPLSQNEQVALSRYLLGMRKQLQEVSDLFATRYGRTSNIAELAVDTLASATRLEHELTLLEGGARVEVENQLAESAAFGRK